MAAAGSRAARRSDSLHKRGLLDANRCEERMARGLITHFPEVPKLQVSTSDLARRKLWR